MMKNSKLKFSEYMQNISRSKSFSKFFLIVYTNTTQSQTDEIEKLKKHTIFHVLVLVLNHTSDHFLLNLKTTTQTSTNSSG